MNEVGRSSVFRAIALVLSGALFGACGDDDGSGAGATGGEGGTGAGAEGGSGGESSNGGGPLGGAGGGGGSPGPTAEVITAFDVAAFELPEGLVLDGQSALVGFAFTGAIEAVALEGGARTPFASAPPPPPNTSFMTGLTMGADGHVYAAYVSFTPDATPGVYRALAGGGDATLWSTHPQMVFPNGFAWDPDGNLYVTDSAVGGVFKIDPTGTASLWIADPSLAGDLEACGPHGDIAVGANGIVYDDGAFWIASSDKALLARVPLEDDGSAGTLEIAVPQNCDLAGIDGIALDEDGTLLAAINRANKIVRIAGDGSVDVVFEGAPLDFPASLELTGSGSSRALVVTSFALGAFLSGGDPEPALVRVSIE